MELMGPNVKELKRFCGNKLSLKTTLLTTLQMLDSIQSLHRSAGFVHNDLKPDNFVIGLGEKSNLLSMIDFGFSTEIIDPVSQEHIEQYEGCNMVGTPLYTSISSHKGRTLSRRDDLESLGYMLVHSLFPDLFMRHVDRALGLRSLLSVKKRLCQILSQSQEASVFGEEVRKNLMDFIKYCQGLNFKDEPNYDYLRTLLRNMSSETFKYKIETFFFDWSVKAVLLEFYPELYVAILKRN